jgi:transposase
MLFAAHDRAFAFFGGVPLRMIYDNPKTLVDVIFTGKCQWPSELTHWRTTKLTHLRVRIIVSLRAFLSADSFLLRA